MKSMQNMTPGELHEVTMWLRAEADHVAETEPYATETIAALRQAADHVDPTGNEDA